MSSTDPGIFIGTGESPQFLPLKYANRHGLVTGATGTGKTVTLQILAQGFSDAGVPVFAADVKGDLSGISQPGKPHPKLEERAQQIGLDPYDFNGAPTIFWDLFGKKGHPIRTTISEMGPLLISRLLGLNETQSGVLDIAFRVADDEGMLILDLKDLRSMLIFVGENAKDISLAYGNISRASVGAIQRRLLSLERQGAKKFFGEPAFELDDLMQLDDDGRGYISLLAADELMKYPKLYATFLLWLLTELFETLPEVGDPDKPKLVFFFDEAHLLFDDAPKALLDKIELLVRLIRSKGVGVFFVTQSPLDVPDDVLGQLGNKVQHALRAFTPKDKKAVKAVGETFRQNPAFDAASVIPDLGIGEALVSTLEKKGRPSVVDRTLIRPPSSRMGPAKPGERRAVISASLSYGKYEDAIDRESAYEMLAQRAEEAQEQAEAEEEKAARARSRTKTTRRKTTRRRSSQRQSVGEAMAKSVVRSIGSTLGREIIRGLMGTFFKGSKRSRRRRS